MKRLSESASSEQFYGYGLLIPKIEVFYFETWGMILNSMDLQGALTGPIYVSVEISMPSPGPPQVRVVLLVIDAHRRGDGLSSETLIYRISLCNLVEQDLVGCQKFSG